MFEFSLVNSIGGSAQVVDRKLFDSVLDSPRVAGICQNIVVNNDVSLKRGLPAFCWHATFVNGKRNVASAIASGLAMIDVDHVDEPQKLFESVREVAIEIGLVAAHITPSTKGLRMVFAMPEGMTVEGMQRWVTEKLQLQGVDGCTKDLARLSFAVPRSYWLYIDYDAIFETNRMDNNGVALKGHNSTAQGSALGNLAPTSFLPPLQGRAGEGQTTFEETYKGVPYTAIVDALETLYGGKPEHGSRNAQIFSMACMLRSICNDDPMWIAKILPNYGENEKRWMSTINSACSRNQVRNIPNLMLKAIEMARGNLAAEPQGTGAGAAELRGTGAGAAEPQGTGADTGAWDKPPLMPEKLPKLIRHLIKNVPEVCRPSVATGVFPALATHLSDVNFRLIDGTKKEATFMCVNMAGQSSGKSSINKPIEYIMADIKKQDDINRQREQDWKDSLNVKGANKEKPKRPADLCIRMLVTDMTNAAFVQRLKDAGGKYIYTNLEELDLLRQLQTNGMKDVGKIICLCFDNGIYGQERVGSQSVTAMQPLRWNWNASSTVEKGMAFFSNRLIDGTLSRINFCTIMKDDTKEFHYGDYDEQFAAELKPFITNLNLCSGEVTCEKALKMAKRLQQKCTEIALQTEDVIYQEFAYRAVTIAYMKAMVLYIANDMTWDKTIEDFCEWSLDYDLWCKEYLFGDAIREARLRSQRKINGNKLNMLAFLPDSFTFADAQEMRRQAGKNVAETHHMLRVWLHRGYVVLDENAKTYEKAPKYRLR